MRVLCRSGFSHLLTFLPTKLQSRAKHVVPAAFLSAGTGQTYGEGAAVAALLNHPLDMPLKEYPERRDLGDSPLLRQYTPEHGCHHSY